MQLPGVREILFFATCLSRCNDLKSLVHPGILGIEALRSRQMRLSIRVKKLGGPSRSTTLGDVKLFKAWVFCLRRSQPLVARKSWRPMAGADERQNCLCWWSLRKWPAHTDTGRTRNFGSAGLFSSGQTVTTEEHGTFHVQRFFFCFDTNSKRTSVQPTCLDGITKAV